MHELKVAFVTALSPSKTTLNEYGYHFARVLGEKAEVTELYALVEEGDYRYPDLEGVTVIPTWSFDSPMNPVKVLSKLRELKPDVVIFNLHFTSFGGSKVPAALGLMIPWFARLAGFKVMTLIHNIMETVDLESAGFGGGGVVEKVIRGIGTVLTKFVLKSHTVAVTLPRYVEILREKYGADNVVLAPHGAFDVAPLPPPPDPDSATQIMTFGKFGTYKTVDTLIEAFQKIRPGRDLELVIAGSDSPNAPGYLDSMKVKYGVDGIRYTGYVPEEAVAKTFLDATLVVFPYTSTTGSSGVLHQAGDYGRPVVMPDIGDLGELVEEEGFMAKFFEPGDADDLARVMAEALDDETWLVRAGSKNHHASIGVPLSEVVDWYLLHCQLITEFDLSPEVPAPVNAG